MTNLMLSHGVLHYDGGGGGGGDDDALQV